MYFILHVPVLSLELLDQEALNVVGFLGNRCMAARRHVGSLLLQLPGEVFNLLFLTIEVDVHLLSTSPQASVFIVSDVMLNFQVSIQILDLFPFLLLEHWVLVRFVLLLSVEAMQVLAIVVGLPVPCLAAIAHVASLLHGAAAEEDVT